MAKEVLPFGAGLDRYTGVMSVEPGSLEDLLNTRPLRGKLQARRGMVLRSTLPDQNGAACSSVPLIQAVQSQQEGIAVGYYEATREVHVYRVAGFGTDPFHIGLWFTLAEFAQSPPRFSSAESYGKAFIAHDEPHIQLRAHTIIYEGLGGTLTNLTTQFGDEEPADVHFRGVETWRDYLVGWGWGGVDDRPELVRISLPGDPATFDEDHYFLVGDRGSPVVACRPAGPHLLAFKPSQTHRILGRSEIDFGIAPLYALFGALSGQLAISVSGVCFFWSFEGPRATTGGPAEDLETFLDIERLPPDHLPSASLARQAFGVYIPVERVIEWHWGSRIYCLHLEGEGPRWSYRNRSAASAAGALLYSQGAGLIDRAVVLGKPQITEVDVGLDGLVTVHWRNELQTGNEVLETWVARLKSRRTVGPTEIRRPRAKGQDWRRTEPDADVTLDDVQSQFILDSSHEDVFGYDYEIAIRYRIFGRYSAEYQSADPSSWPEVSRSTFSTLSAPAPSLTKAEWERVAPAREIVVLEWSEVLADRLSYSVYREKREGDYIEPSDEPIATLELGVSRYVDESFDGEQGYLYSLVAHLGDRMSERSLSKLVYTGPAPPTDVTVVLADPLLRGHVVAWTVADVAYGTIIEVNGKEVRRDPAASTTQFYLFLGGSSPTVRVRSVANRYSRDDFSEWVYA